MPIFFSYYYLHMPPIILPIPSSQPSEFIHEIYAKNYTSTF